MCILNDIYQITGKCLRCFKSDSKSLIQNGLPVTVSYPSMVAEVAPYFEGGVIPEEGKDNLWFL
jgi:hypothetical protein